MEAAGVVEAVGADVDNVKPGDRIHAEVGILRRGAVVPGQPIDRPLDDITDQAAAMMLKGLTASYLITKTFLVAGQTVLFHAAVGGVGLIICHWLNQLPHRHRHRRQRREGGSPRPAAVHHQLQHRGFRRASDGDHRRRRRAGGL